MEDLYQQTSRSNNITFFVFGATLGLLRLRMDDQLRDNDIPDINHDNSDLAPKIFGIVFRMRIRNVPLQPWIIQAFDKILYESHGSRSDPDSLLPQVIARCGGKKGL